MLPLQITPLLGFNRPLFGSTVKQPVFSGEEASLGVQDEYTPQNQPLKTKTHSRKKKPVNPADWTPGWEALMLETKNEGLVSKIAKHLAAMLSLDGSTTLDDLISLGTIGLMDAARKHDPERGANFQSYASQRIRGNIFDGLREMSILTRRAIQNRKKVKDIRKGLLGELGYPPTSMELKLKLIETLKTENEIDVAENPSKNKIKIKTQAELEKTARNMLRDSEFFIFSYDDPGLTAEDSEKDPDNILEKLLLSSKRGTKLIDNNSPLQHLLNKELSVKLVKTFEALPPKEKQVMEYLVEGDLNLREIGEILEVSESRVCQLRGQAKKRLRRELRDLIPKHLQ